MLNSTRVTHLLLVLVALALTANITISLVKPRTVEAQAGNSDPMYFEPGVYMLRLPNGGQVLGKVAINLRTGGVWGFPTNTSDPYPMSPIDSKPQLSHPISLGRFALNEMSH